MAFDVELPIELEEIARRANLTFNSKGEESDLTVAPESISQQDAELEPWQWFACRHPERPHEAFRTVYHDCCTPCMIAAQAAGFNVVPLMAWRIEVFGEAEA